MLADARPKVFLVAMSDTHGMHRTMNTRNVVDSGCDLRNNTILVHSGDASGTLEQTRDFNLWMDEDPVLHEIPKERKFVVYGNHDNWFSTLFRHSAGCNFTLLVNSGRTLDFQGRALSIFGTTYHIPEESSWDSIFGSCNDVDILVTHAPISPHHRLNDPALWPPFTKMLPPAHLPRRIHISGHAHERYFVKNSESLLVTWVGASVNVAPDEPLLQPLVIPLHFLKN
ncbi:hypothetical protein Pelo_7605 [Pelomyxa schiedti]|nr:hypothetical protein Pelo_7605 [Pelomyxa schiedti]